MTITDRMYIALAVMALLAFIWLVVEGSAK